MVALADRTMRFHLDGGGNPLSAAPNGIDPAYDADEALLMVYDDWNRLVKVYKDDGTTAREIDSGDTLIAQYQYDGQNRRITKTVGETATHFFFNESWQVLETRVGAGPDPLDQYVWDIRYIDAAVVRFHDAGTNGSYEDAGDNILYYTQDANFNTTALVDEATGDGVERYLYDPYGEATVLDEDWEPVAGNESAVANTRQFGSYEFNPETGLFLAQSRYYHCTLAVWTARDMPYIDGLNLYAYCRANPVGRVDPSGQAGSPPRYIGPEGGYFKQGIIDSPAPGKYAPAVTFAKAVATTVASLVLERAYASLQTWLAGAIVNGFQGIVTKSDINKVCNLGNEYGTGRPKDPGHLHVAGRDIITGELEGLAHVKAPDGVLDILLGEPLIHFSLNFDAEIVFSMSAQAEKPIITYVISAVADVTVEGETRQVKRALEIGEVTDRKVVCACRKRALG